MIIGLPIGVKFDTVQYTIGSHSHDEFGADRGKGHKRPKLENFVNIAVFQRFCLALASV